MGVSLFLLIWQSASAAAAASRRMSRDWRTRCHGSPKTFFKPDQLEFKDESIRDIIQYFTREAGVRNLEREIGSVCRKLARKVVKKEALERLEVASGNLSDFLGVRKFRNLKSEEKNEVGLTTGLAWTEVGGEILGTEATLMQGKGKLTLTGKLGDVMQESAQAAMSYVRSRTDLFGIPKDFYRHYDIHIHVPEGSIPKDGPSAGITMATTLVSVLTRIPVRRDVAMTGEITLRGKVLPIGGVKEKLLAAHRAGINTVILPKDNEKDLAEIPPEIQKAFELHFVENMDEVLKIALVEPLLTTGRPADEPLEMTEEFKPALKDEVSPGSPHDSMTH